MIENDRHYHHDDDGVFVYVTSVIDNNDDVDNSQMNSEIFFSTLIHTLIHFGP